MRLLDLPLEIIGLIMKEIVTTLLTRSYLRKRLVCRLFDVEVKRAAFTTGVTKTWLDKLYTLRIGVSGSLGRPRPLVAACLAWHVEYSPPGRLEIVDVIRGTSECLSFNGHDYTDTIKVLCSAAIAENGYSGIMGHLHPGIWWDCDPWPEQTRTGVFDHLAGVAAGGPVLLASHDFSVKAALSDFERNMGTVEHATLISAATPDISQVAQSQAMLQSIDLLIAASCVGDITLVRSLMKLGIPLRVNSRYFGGAQSCAAREGHRAVFLLIERNKSRHESSCPHSRSKHSQKHLAHNYHNRSCKPDQVDLQSDGCCSWAFWDMHPLSVAARYGRRDIFRIAFLERSLFSPVTTFQCDLEEAAFHAACGGYSDLVEFILDHNPVCLNSWTFEEQKNLGSRHILSQIMQSGAIHNHADIVKAMLDLGVSPNLRLTGRKASSQTILGTAAYLGHYDIVAMLLERGADVNCTPPSLAHMRLCCPIGDACYGGHIQIVRLLLKFDPELNLSRRKPLEIATGTQNHTLVELILDSGPEALPSIGRALIFMEDEPNVKTLRTLLDREAVEFTSEDDRDRLRTLLRHDDLTPELLSALEELHEYSIEGCFGEQMWPCLSYC